MTQAPEIIGLIPAGGQSMRLSPLPMSKELYPIGWRETPDGQIRSKVIAHYLMENIRAAGIRKAFVILRPGKWDIPAYLGDGSWLEMDLGYLVARLPHGTPHTLDQAYPFVKDAIVAFGYPDILFEPTTQFIDLVKRQARTSADVVIGVVPFTSDRKGDAVELAGEQVTQILEKPTQSGTYLSWCTAVWGPRFTEFLHQFLAEVEEKRELMPIPEISVGSVIQAAILKGLRVEAEVFPNGSYWDIGTPKGLMQATYQLSSQALKHYS
jgi:glucose-1-phosphate thymidylyltransferase